MTKDSRFNIVLPITITEKDRVEILERISDFDLPEIPCLSADSLTPISDITPEMVENALELHERFDKTNPLLLEYINKYVNC